MIEKKIELVTQGKCDATKWNQATGRAKSTKAEVVQLNSYLDTIQGNIFEIQKEHELKKNDPLIMKDWVFGKPFWPKLNKLKKSNPEAFFYWYKIFELATGQD